MKKSRANDIAFLFDIMKSIMSIFIILALAAAEKDESVAADACADSALYIWQI